jgi:hypothetical protein
VSFSFSFDDSHFGFLVIYIGSGWPPGRGVMLPALSSLERSRCQDMLVSEIKFGNV